MAKLTSVHHSECCNTRIQRAQRQVATFYKTFCEGVNCRHANVTEPIFTLGIRSKHLNSIPIHDLRLPVDPNVAQLTRVWTSAENCASDAIVAKGDHVEGSASTHGGGEEVT
jgi:hypothetical protein